MNIPQKVTLYPALFSGEKGSPGNPDTVPTSRDDKPALLHQPKDPQRPRASVKYFFVFFRIK